MKTAMKYKLLTAGTARELEAHVNRDLRNGKWTPQGGVVTVEYPNAKDADLIQTLWAQALVSTPVQASSDVSLPAHEEPAIHHHD